MPQATCPHCQAVVAFSEDERGNIIPCSRCEQRFRLPAARATRAARRSWEDEDADAVEVGHRAASRKKSGPNWLLLGLLGGGLLLLVCGGVVGLGIFFMAKEMQKEMEEEEAEMQRAKAQAIAVNADELVRQFRADQNRANDTYVANWVRVHGVVDEVGADADGPAIVYLQGGGAPAAGRIACHFDGDDENMSRRAKQLLKGRAVTILGNCSGQEGGNIELDQCELVD